MSVRLTDGEVREEDLLKVSRSISQQIRASLFYLFVRVLHPLLQTPGKTSHRFSLISAFPI